MSIKIFYQDREKFAEYQIDFYIFSNSTMANGEYLEMHQIMGLPLCAIDNDDYEAVGTYTDKKRAKEVLMDIVDSVNRKYESLTMPKE